MPAFLAILRYDVDQMLRSWVARLWVVLLAAPAIFLVLVAASEKELASETMAAYLGAILVPLSAIAIAILTSNAIAGEAQIIADGILSRSVTRTEFVSAKIVARLGFALLVYLLVVLPFAYLLLRYSVTDDIALSGLFAALFTTAVLLIFFGALGLTLSTLMNNVMMSILVLLVLTISSGLLFDFLGLDWLSATAILSDLAPTLRGENSLWEALRATVVFGGLTAGAIFTTLTVFKRRDL